LRSLPSIEEGISKDVLAHLSSRRPGEILVHHSNRLRPFIFGHSGSRQIGTNLFEIRRYDSRRHTQKGQSTLTCSGVGYRDDGNVIDPVHSDQRRFNLGRTNLDLSCG